MTFEWDKHKAAANLKKHGVRFTDAVTVFFDPFALTFADPDHSSDEHREITIGSTLNGEVLFISHCARPDSIRLISARHVTRAERKYYEEGI